jgi:hypothetical protein
MFKNQQESSDAKPQFEVSQANLPGKSVTELMAEQQKAE